MPDGFDGACAIWADAATALREPSVENVRKFASHKEYEAGFAANEVVQKLPAQEARLTFFQSLPAATGGVHDSLGVYVWTLAKRVPFGQLAFLADNAPAFRPSKPDGESFDGLEDEARGSLRTEVAIDSRDSTATRRWKWLTQREEDRPTGKLLGRLVANWCKNDYADTAAWVRSATPR